MSIKAVIFDWGGTLTPWHDVDLIDLWRNYSRVYAPDRVDELAIELHHSEQSRWSRQFNTGGEIGTGALNEMFGELGIDVSSEEHHVALATYLAGWTPHTYADPDAIGLLSNLRDQGIKLAVLSNTLWPRSHHEAVLERDGLLDFFDFTLFTSETPTGKPHATVFTQVLYALDVEANEAAFVGDRIFDDIHGAQQVGMRGIWIPHSTIPATQSTDLNITPAATVQRLGDVADVVAAWNNESNEH